MYAGDEEAWVLFQRAAPVFVVVPLNPMLSSPYRSVVVDCEGNVNPEASVCGFPDPSNRFWAPHIFSSVSSYESVYSTQLANVPPPPLSFFLFFF